MLMFFQVPLTFSPVSGRRLNYTTFSVDIGVTDVTKNSGPFTVTSTTCSTLLLAVFFPPIDTQQALGQHTECPCRFVMLATKSSVVTSFETGICIHSKFSKIPGTYAVYTYACGVWVVFLEYGCGALGIVKSPCLLYTSPSPRD